MVIEGPVIVHIADQKETPCKKVDDPGDPFAHVETMDPEETEKREQYPGYIVAVWPRAEAKVGLAVHGRDKEQIHNPPDEEQAEGEEVNRAGNRFPVIKPMRAGETEDPQDIAHGFEMGIMIGFHVRSGPFLKVIR